MNEIRRNKSHSYRTKDSAAIQIQGAAIKTATVPLFFITSDR